MTTPLTTAPGTTTEVAAPLLRVDGLTVTYATGRRRSITAVHEASVTVDAGEFVTSTMRVSSAKVQATRCSNSGVTVSAGTIVTPAPGRAVLLGRPPA